MPKPIKDEHASKDTRQSMRENDERLRARQATTSGVDEVPTAEEGSHSKSHAAHLHGGSEHTKPAGDLRQGSDPGARREPPQGQGRS